MNSKAAMVLVLLGLAAAGGYYFWFNQEVAAPPQVPVVVAIPPIEDPEPEINFPVEDIAPPPALTIIEEQLPDRADRSGRRVDVHAVALVLGARGRPVLRLGIRRQRLPQCLHGLRLPVDRGLPLDSVPLDHDVLRDRGGCYPR